MTVEHCIFQVHQLLRDFSNVSMFLLFRGLITTARVWWYGPDFDLSGPKPSLDKNMFGVGVSVFGIAILSPTQRERERERERE